MSEKHSTVVGGSTAGITIKCNASIDERRKVPDNASIYAATGTALHTIAEISVRENLADDNVMKRFANAKFADLLHKDAEIEEFGHHIVDAKMIRDKIFPLLAWLDDEIFGKMEKGDEIEFYQEHKVDFQPRENSPYDEENSPFKIEGAFGTGDVFFTIEDKNGDVKRVGAIDFKFGEGNIVDPADNAQGKFYLSGAVHTGLIPDVQDVPYEFWIFQPAYKSEPDEYARRADYTQTDLDNFAYALRDTVEGERVHEAGAHCKHCRGKIVCPAYQDLLDRVEKTDIEGMNNKQLAAARDFCDTLKAYIKDVEAHCLRQALNGVTIPGWRVEDDAEGHRKYNDETAAFAALGRIGVPLELRRVQGVISPSEALAWMKSNGISEKQRARFEKTHVTRPTMPPRLVRTKPGEVDGDGIAHLAVALEAQE